MDSSGSEQVPVVYCCEYDDETSGSIKSGEFLTSLATVTFLRRNVLYRVR